MIVGCMSEVNIRTKRQLTYERHIAAFFSIDHKDISEALTLLEKNRDSHKNESYQEMAYDFKRICACTGADFKDRQARWKYLQACLTDKTQIICDY